MPKVFVGTFVDCPALGQLRILKDHVLAIDETGSIAICSPRGSDLGTSALARASHEHVVFMPKDSFFLPSFCDLHVHAPQYLYQGTGLHLPLMEWLDKYAFKAEEQIDGDEGLARQVYTRLASRLKENGTGAVLLFGTIKEETNLILAEIMQTAGIRAFVGKLSMDQCSRPTYVEASAQDALTAAESFSQKCLALYSHLPVVERLVEPVLTPRFVPTCSDALLRGLGQLSESQGLRIQSHLAEARDQVEWVKRERGVDDIQVFDQNALLTQKTVQAHCTFLPSVSLQQLKDRGTSVAHCPLSNAYFSSRPFCLREALDLGLEVGLGTDVAGGYSLDIMNAMRTAVVVSRMREGQRTEDNVVGASLGIDWKDALYLATHGGARALSLPDGVGMFKTGAPFDAQLIQVYDAVSKQPVGPLDYFHDFNADCLSEEMVEKWWCIGDTRNRKELWVQGRRCFFQA